MLPRVVIVAISAVCPCLFAQSSVVISQIYGGGGNMGATYRNDFIELFNRGSNAVNVTGWSVQYAAGGGTTWQVTALTSIIPPGGYYLVQQGSGGAVGTNLPAADATGTVSMSASAGKIALLNNTTALIGACPLPHPTVVDFVGYGSAATCAESRNASAMTSTTALRRAAEGCADFDDNAADFFAGEVIPRNSSSPTNRCEFVATIRSIHEIQGSNSTSQLVGQFVITTTNIVTGIRNNGFFLQTPEGSEDANPQTSEGIFVSTSMAAPEIGDAVGVSGIVTEFRPPNDLASPARTQINATSFRFVSAGNPLPEPVTLTSADMQPNGGHEQLEPFEGMRVRVEALFVAGPTDGFLDEPSATAFSSGVFYGVPWNLRPFREPGIDLLSPLPPGTPCCVPRFDGNPEMLRIDSDAQPGTSAFDVGGRLLVGNLIGPLYYEARRYTLLPDADSPPQVLVILPGPGVPPRSAREVSIASLNLERFYDTTDAPSVGDVILTPVAYSNRLHKAALLIAGVMGTPDILGVAEVENLTVLQNLAAAIPSMPYTALLIEGNDPGGIDVGFLVNTARVQVVGVTQHGKAATFPHPITGAQATLHDRPPLMLHAAVLDPNTTQSLSLTIIMNHVRSLLDIEDAASGAFVRAKRRAQSEDIARLAQQRQTVYGDRVVVMGDFNAFEFSDGYVDVMGAITGSPAPSNEVVLASPDLVEPNLINLIETLPHAERYSYVFDGHAQALDHILVSESVRQRVTRFFYVRRNADAPEILRNYPEYPDRVSDHDAAMVYMIIGTVPRITSLQRGTGDVVLDGEGPVNHEFRVERSADLQGWQQIGSATADQAGRFSFRDGNPVSGAAFYRLRATDPN